MDRKTGRRQRSAVLAASGSDAPDSREPGHLEAVGPPDKQGFNKEAAAGRMVEEAEADRAGRAWSFNRATGMSSD